MSEHNFGATTKDSIAKSAMVVCSNPHCLRFTGYATSEGEARAIAEAAHMLPNGKSGPRHEEVPAFPDIDLSSPANGIWLCTGCHKKVDRDPKAYPIQMLLDWKKEHEGTIRRLVGLDLEAALLELRGNKRYHEETRELLSFLDGQRVLYEGMDYEFPPRVLQSIELMRVRIAHTRAMVNPTTDLAEALNAMQLAINTLLRNIGPHVDLNELFCDSNDPVWVKFSDEVVRFRMEMSVIIAYLAEGSGYTVTYVY
jgi:hypothetical protein